MVFLISQMMTCIIFVLFDESIHYRWREMNETTFNTSECISFNDENDDLESKNSTKIMSKSIIKEIEEVKQDKDVEIR